MLLCDGLKFLMTKLKTMYRNWIETITNEVGIWKCYYSTKHKDGNYPYFVECVKKF